MMSRDINTVGRNVRPHRAEGKAMEKSRKIFFGAVVSTMTCLAPAAAFAQDDSVKLDERSSTPMVDAVDEPKMPLRDGSYIAVLATYQEAQDDPVLSSTFGGRIRAGFRNGFYGFESGLAYSEGSGVQQQSFRINGLIYPFSSLPMLYGLVGGGATRYVDYPIERTTLAIAGGDDFVTGDLAAGLGYIFPLRIGRYQFGLRAEAEYRVGDRFIERESDFEPDIAAPDTFKDVIINVGLQLPLRRVPQQPKPEPAVAVVAPADSDGDGVLDDVDACPQTPQGVKVDNSGCALPPPPPPPPCKMPEPGERLSLDGCGTGDVLELEGVNFEFDKDKLTPNAKTLLDQVAAELNDHPGIDIEIGGHTDSLGSDSYNQRLSASRAAAVMAYLGESGVESSRMSSKGYGEDVPIDTNETEDGRERNRRVELKIVGGTAGATGSEATPYEDRDSMRPSSEAAKPENESSADKSASESPPSTDEDDSSDDLDFLDF